MKKPEITVTCQGCGRAMGGYEISITKGMINALRKLIKAVRDKGENSIHLSDDTKGKPYELTHSEINNITRLRFHGLVAKVYEGSGESKKRKSGHWLVTRRAASFIKGEMTLPRAVWIFNDHIVDRGTEEQITIKQILGEAGNYWDTIDDINYREAQVSKTGEVRLL